MNSINRELSEDHESIRLFKALEASHPQLAQNYFNVSRVTILAQGEHELFSRYVKDLAAYLRVEIESHQKQVAFINEKNLPQLASLQKPFDEALVVTTLQLADVAMKNGDPALASKLKLMTLERMDDPRLTK